MPRPASSSERRRRWVSGLAVTLCTIVAYLAFWHLAPVATFVIGTIALFGMAVFGWIMGGRSDD